MSEEVIDVSMMIDEEDCHCIEIDSPYLVRNSSLTVLYRCAQVRITIEVYERTLKESKRF